MYAYAEVDGGETQYESSVFAYWKPSLDTYSDSPAVICTHQSPSYLSELIDTLPAVEGSLTAPSCLTWTYRDLHIASLKFVNALSNHGLGPGSSIAFLVPNGVEWALTSWAAELGKYAVTYVDFNALSSARSDELAATMASIQPDVVIIEGSSGAPFVDQAIVHLARTPILKLVVNNVSEALAVKGWKQFVKAVAGPVEASLADQITLSALHDDIDRLTTLTFTSGTTTGKPKCCPRLVLQKMHLTACMEEFALHTGPGVRCAMYTANFRVIAGAISGTVWRVGGCVVIPGPMFSLNELFDAIEQHKVSDLVFIPAMVHAFVAHPRFATANLDSVNNVRIGADMVTQGLYRKAAGALPHAVIRVAHGMTEGGSSFTWPLPPNPGNQEHEIPWYTGIAPIGKVNVGTRLRIAAEDNKALRPGETGELHICSNGIIKEYLYGIKPEDFYDDEHGRWFKTGDTGNMNEDGWFFLLGRKKDIIKRAGVTIQPATIENVIDTQLKTQSSVLGVPHEILGQEPFAVIADLGTHSKQDVSKLVKDTFGSDSVLRGVVTLEELGLTDFPINATNKIMKLELLPPVMLYLKNADAERV